MAEYQNYADLPLILDAEDLKSIMNISRAGAYQLMHRSDFPTISIGKRLLVPRDQFIIWLNQNTRVTSNE